METLYNLLIGKQAFDATLFEEDNYVSLIHLLDMVIGLSIAFFAARKVYRQRISEQPPSTITRAEDNRHALLEAKNVFTQRLQSMSSLLIGVICLLVSLFMVYITGAVILERPADWWQILSDSIGVLGLAAVFGAGGIFLLRIA